MKAVYVIHGGDTNCLENESFNIGVATTEEKAIKLGELYVKNYGGDFHIEKVPLDLIKGLTDTKTKASVRHPEKTEGQIWATIKAAGGDVSKYNKNWDYKG